MIVLYVFVRVYKRNIDCVYQLIPENIIKRLRYPRYLCMDLKFSFTDGKEINMQEQINILKEVIDSGSILGSSKLDLLVQNGYLVRTNFVVQTPKKQESGEEEYKLPSEIKEEEKLKLVSISDINSYYMINHSKFIHLMRSYELRKLAETKLDRQAGIIIGVILDESKLLGKSSEYEHSETMSFSQIFNKLKGICELNDPSDKRVTDIKPLIESETILKTHLEIMQADSAEFIKKVKVDVNSGESFYRVQVNNLVMLLQERCVEKIIEETYSRYHKRVYRILRVNGFLDENEIIKHCFMPPRNVRSIINTLFQDGITIFNII